LTQLPNSGEICRKFAGNARDSRKLSFVWIPVPLEIVSYAARRQISNS
jgi:hypothetical protein